MEEKYGPVVELLSKTFDYELIVPDKKTEEDFIREAVEKLTPVIEYLLDKDYNRLLAILYRIDVNENKLKECFAGTGFTDVAACIAKSVVERQMMKVKLRG